MSIRQVVRLLFMVCLLINLGTITINAEEIIYEVKFSLDDVSFGTQNGYDTVTLPDCIFTMEPGKPQLPLKVLHFAIDQDKNISDIELIADTTEEINGQYYIYPAQKPTRMDEKLEFTPPNKDTYNSSESYPKEKVEIKAKGSLSGTKIVTVHVYPLEYIPIEKKLILHTVMRLKVVQENKSSSSASIQTETTTSAPSIAKRSIKGNDTIKSMLKKVIANPECIDGQFKKPVQLQSLDVGIPKSSGNGIDYLIITSEDLKNSGVFQPLIDSKVARGLSVAVETIEDIEAIYPGRDTPEKIRNCIKDKWVNNGLVWVLLGGDTNIVPVRVAEMWDNPPCDMYYSDLDGDWDANGNDLFGEEDDNVDFYPDVFVGRAPVEDEIEAQVFVDKVLTYEANAQYYANKALFLGGADNFDAGGRNNDLIEAEYMPAGFYPITKYYQSDIAAYSQLTIDAMNQGYHLINHIDHADINILYTGGYWDHISIDDIDSLTNALSPSIFYSIGCWPAAIDYDCIAEHWVNNPNGGGVAFIGNTRSGLFVYSEYLQEEFYKSLFIDSFNHIGETLADSKTTFIGQAQSDYGLRYCLFELSLLGDPEMNIWTDMSLLPHISFPSMNSFIQGEVDIEGSVVCDEMNFAGYELYYSPKDDAEDTTLIVSSITPVENGLLGVWNTDIVECPDGEYILTLKVIDINGREFTYSVGVTIDNYNQVPEFINLTNKGAVIGRDLEFKVEVHDPDDPQTSWGDLTYSAYNLPIGATFDPETQIFLWSPTEEDKGNYEVIFTVSDNEYTTTQDVLITTVVIEETPICTAPYDQGYPSIYGDKIVWQDGRNEDHDGNIDIYIYDCLTGEETSICTETSRQSFPVIFKNKIVWMDSRNSGDDYCDPCDTRENWDIYIYSLTTEEETPVCTEAHYQGFPAIYENKIVWEDYRSEVNHDIYMYNFIPETEIRITTNGGNNYKPHIYKDKIIWLSPRGGLGSDIYMYDLSKDEEIQITNDLNFKRTLDICKNKIVWWEESNGYGGDIYMYDIITEEKIPICTTYDPQFLPAIYEDKIIWEDYRRKLNADIYMYDMSTNTEVQITTNTDKQSCAAVYGNKIVWQDDRNGYDDIYMATVIFAPQLISVNPTEVSAGEVLTITGKNLGYGRDDSTVEFENGAVCPVISWSNTEITCTVPQDAVTGLVRVITNGGTTDGMMVTITYNISGTVTLSGGSSSVEEVVLSLSGALSEDTNPDTAGNYSFTGLEEGLYIVTPSLTDYHFFPSSRSYPLLESDQTSQNFTGLHETYDSDMDTLPDWWELENFDNLDQGPDDDPDGDFYTNLEEYTYDTDPNDPESNPSVVWYVDDDAADTGTGTSWNNAFKYLQDALTNQQLHVGDEIWVGQGTYKPDEGSGITDNDRNAYFRLVSGVAVKGGYAGIGAPTPNERNITTYQTTLSGDIDGDGTLTNNSYTVVRSAIGGNPDTTINGFTITGGNNDSSYTYSGGMTNFHSGYITIKNCIFKENQSVNRAGGMFNIGTNHLIKVINCFFINNSGVQAGGMLNVHCPLEVTNCVFSGNSSTDGGGITINGCSFEPYTAKVTNCTFYGNSATTNGGGICNINSILTITNSILWNNGEEIYNYGSPNAAVTYCDIEGGYTGEGNIDADPSFVDTALIAGADDIFGTADDGLQLNVNSPCVDFADDSEASDSDILDIGRIDVPDIGFAIADMGAYESVWPYKKIVTISPSSVDLTDYQVKINIAYEPDMQPDFADLRFVDQGENILDYWLENYTEYENAVVWVKIPSIPTTGTTIDMYYGNPEAESLSNGDNTFVFFDDFNGVDGNDIDTAKWGWTNQPNNRATYSNSYARSGETCMKVVSSLDTGGQPYHRFDSPMSNAELTAWVYDSGSYTIREALVGEYYARCVGIKSSVDYYYKYRIVDSPSTYYNTTILRTVGWHKMQMRCDGIDTSFYIDDIPVATIPGLDSFGQIFVGNSHVSPTTDYFDDVTVRRYSSPEPTATVEE